MVLLGVDFFPFVETRVQVSFHPCVVSKRPRQSIQDKIEALDHIIRASKFYLKAGAIQVKISEFLICAKYLAIRQLHIRKPAVYCFTMLAAIVLKKLTGLSPVPVVS